MQLSSCIGMISAGKLTIGTREGSFPGMIEKHTFNVVVVGEGKGVGIGDGAAQGRAVSYKGDRVEFKP